MQRIKSGNFIFVLVAASLVLVAVLSVGLVLAYAMRGPAAAPMPTPTFEPFVLPTASDPYIPAPGGRVQRRTWCPECKATGVSANVWTDAAMSQVVCRLNWDVAVSVIEQSGDMALVSGQGCRGWIRTSLLR